MGRGGGGRKRNPTTRSTTVAPADDGDSQQQSPTPPSPTAAASDDAAAVRSECEKALSAVRRGNHTRALKLMKDFSSRHAGSALFHRAHGTVHLKVASIIDDPSTKLRHLRLAVDSARAAVSLSPASVELAHFHATLLFEAASADGRGSFDEVVHECERALAVEAPTDPALDSISPVEDDRKLASLDSRVAYVQQELRSLVQKSSIASISTWMKRLNGAGGEEKIRFIPMQRISDDPAEMRLVPAAARRPNEIRKAIKTPEERRKEIEVRVAAARLLQQKSESSDANQEDEAIAGNEALPSLPGSAGAQRLVERRKMMDLRKFTASAERMSQVRAYWNSMAPESRRDFLEVSVSDLRAHYSKDVSVVDFFQEALAFAEARQVWRFWECTRCKERFTGCESLLQHTLSVHISKLSPRFQSVLPQKVDDDWVDMLNKGCWKPFHALEAIKMMEKDQSDDCRSASMEFECNGGCKDNNGSLDHWSFKINGSISSPRGPCEDIDDISVRVAKVDSQGWPESDDPERAKLIERIISLFSVLAKHGCLSISHLDKVMQFAKDEVGKLMPESSFLNHLQDHSLLFICLLDAPELRRITKFLQELLHACGLTRQPDKDNNSDDANGAETENVDHYFVACNSSLVLIDPRAFNSESGGGIIDGFSPDDDRRSYPDVNALVSWLFSDPSGGEQVVAWNRMREENSQKGMETLQMFEKEFCLLHNLCDRKSDHSSYVDTLLCVENLCEEESKKIELVVDGLAQGYEITLKKRQEYLAESETFDMIPMSCRLELDVISNLLKEAQALNMSSFGLEDALSGVNSCLSDLERVDDDDYRIQAAIQRQKEQLSTELCKIDSRILRSLASMQQFENKLGPVLGFDYRWVILCLVKTFLRLLMEDLVDKCAKEKSDAVSEAFLAELEYDAKRNSSKGADHSRHGQDKSKEKKKNKDNRKAKDNKVVSYNEPSHQETTDQSELSTPVDGDVGSELTESFDYLKLEEEYRRKIEIEEEERKLEETLEHQRQLENELAEKSKNCEDAILKNNGSTHASLPNGKYAGENQLLNSNSVNVTSYEQDVCSESSSNDVQALSQNSEPLNESSGLKHDDAWRVSVPEKTNFGSKRRHKRGSKPGTTALDRQAQFDQRTSKEDISQEDLLSSSSVKDIFGTGLKNAAGEYNCFLNVIIQSLWHLQRFRDEFLRISSVHRHLENHCVVCALCDIFTELSKASEQAQKDAVDPNCLRVALSNLYPHKNIFQEGQMNDASEVLAVIFECLHQGFASGLQGVELEENCPSGSWDCSSDTCVAHNLFGMNIYELMSCCYCNLESRHLKYTSFFHNINASALRTTKLMHANGSFDELLNLVERNHQLACDVDAGGCGRLNYVTQSLSTSPYVFTIVLGWQKMREGPDDISATLAAITTKVDINVLYHGVDNGKLYTLVSVVCYYGQHYYCFAFIPEHQRWFMYDDQTVKAIGDWDDVLLMCKKGHLQPQVLFFETAS